MKKNNLLNRQKKYSSYLVLIRNILITVLCLATACFLFACSKHTETNEKSEEQHSYKNRENEAALDIETTESDETKDVIYILDLTKVSDGKFTLENNIYDLNNQAIEVKNPIQFIGPGKIKNAHLIVTDTNQVSFENIETENVHISIHNANDVSIKNMKFRKIHADVLGFIVLSGNSNNITIDGNDFSDILYKTSATTYGCGIKIIAQNVKMSGINVVNNNFQYIYGPAAIWTGGNNSTIEGLTIANNTIKFTENFGIEFFQHNGLLEILNGYITGNELSDIGLIREPGSGVGCGGIYSNLQNPQIYVEDNRVMRVLEVGIEGCYMKVANNYIEDTGYDQINFPIRDSAGIYSCSPKIYGNTIVNPGYYGGIHLFTESVASNMDIRNNVIKNEFKYWQPNTSYNEGDLVVYDGNWYLCVLAGTSGNKWKDTKDYKVKDGTCIWNFKKPLANTAIRINALGGIENLQVRDNQVIDIERFNEFSAFIDYIYILGNVHSAINLNEDDLQFLTGYGNRTIENGEIQ